MSVISKLWRACLPPQRTFFLFHLVHLQIFAARALGMLLQILQLPATPKVEDLHLGYTLIKEGSHRQLFLSISHVLCHSLG
jgi:hypothetical protein